MEMVHPLKMGEINMPYSSKERQLEYNRLYKQKNREKIRESNKRYRERNREKLNLYYKEWREKNREKVLNYARRYYQDHKAQCLETDKKRYAKNRKHKINQVREWQRENQNIVRANTWLKGCRYGGFLKGTGICIICGEINPFALQNHHIFGKGSMVISLCAICHHMLHNSAPREMLMERLNLSDSAMEMKGCFVLGDLQ